MLSLLLSFSSSFALIVHSSQSNPDTLGLYPAVKVCSVKVCYRNTRFCGHCECEEKVLEVLAGGPTRQVSADALRLGVSFLTSSQPPWKMNLP